MQDKDLSFAIIITTLSIFSLVLIVIITLSVSYRQRLRQQIALSETQLRFEQELRTVEQEAQETVMKNISRELHDNIGQLLTLTRIQVEQGKKKCPEAEPILSRVNETITSAIRQVRSLSNTLNSEFIERNGLRETILQEVVRLQQMEYVTVHIHADDTEPQLSKDQSLMSFRIFQEMLNNTLKHAQARNIHISLAGAEHFCLQVKDDGCGFDAADVMQQQNGNGLKNMEKRAALAGLAFEVMSAPGEGCTYIIRNAVTTIAS